MSARHRHAKKALLVLKGERTALVDLLGAYELVSEQERANISAGRRRALCS